ncbi:hypothetical protein BG005_002548 [Podila minutissima]|nr:hypothetical protein BG005_002548 [Podila minutissima]
MSTSVSIFDIHLIVDTICVDLSLYDVQSCRSVNKQWSATFKPHLWSTTKLSWTTTLCDKEKNALLKNKHWIRSLTVDAEHVESISDLSAFTTLQELVFSDGNSECRQKEHGVVNVESLVALIDSNNHLQSLEIDLHNHHYSSAHFSSALILAIARHPTLSKLTWLVPEDHNRNDFARCILYACHSTPIQELHIYERPSSRPKHYNRYYQEGCTPCYPRRYYCDQTWFENDDLEDDDTTTTVATTTTTTTTIIPRYTGFVRKLDQPLDAHGMFALQRLHLGSYAFSNFHLPLLNASPALQHVTLSHFAGLELETLASHPSLRGLDFCYIRYGALNCATELERFSQHWLQSVHLPEMTKVQFSMAVHVLQESNLAALEVLGMHRDSAMNKDIVAVLNIFPNLKEVDFADVKIYLRGGTQGEGGDALDLDHESCVQSLGDLYSMATIARDWDPAQKRRPTGDMADWWKHWNRAATFMKAVREEYLKQCRIQSKRSIRMRFMYPLRAFMSRKEIEEYRRLRNGWGFTLMDAYYMAQAIEKEVERKKEEIRRERNADMGVDSEEEQEEESECEWSGYGQVEEELELEREYSVAKSRNRRHNLKSKMRSVPQGPFRK